MNDPKSFRLISQDKHRVRRMARDYVSRLRTYLVTGIIVTVPTLVTAWVFYEVVLDLEGVLKFIPQSWQIRDWSIREVLLSIPGLGMVATVLCVIIVGFLTTNILGRRAVRFTERVIHRVPILSTIYQGVKQLVESLFSADQSRFSDVVYIQYPRKELWSVGFLTGETFEGACRRIGARCLNVFVPTTPNPTSGYYLIVPIEDVIHADLTIEEAFKLIMSAGIVSPEGQHKGADVDLYTTASIDLEQDEEPTS